VNTKRAYRRLEVLGRCLLVLTFVEDSARVLLHWRFQMRFMLHAFGQTTVGTVVGHAVLATSTVVQLTGSLLLVVRKWEEHACLLLLVWATIHPLLYRQVGNRQLLATSASIVGGLLLVLAERSRTSWGEPMPRTQLAGRLLSTCVLLFHAFTPLWTDLWEGHSPSDSLATTAAEVVIAVGASLLCGLVMFGFKSRWSAAMLVLCLFVADSVLNPFWTLEMTVHRDLVDAAQFFYFHTLSAAGALLLLVLYGPGTASIDESAGPLPLVAVKANE